MINAKIVLKSLDIVVSSSEKKISKFENLFFSLIKGLSPLWGGEEKKVFPTLSN